MPLYKAVGNGNVIAFDLQDYELVYNTKWYVMDNKKSRTKYLIHTARGHKTTYLHRVLMQPEPGMVVDHIDGNGLNNTRSNLRICTRQENRCNQRRRKDSGSGYKGVFKHCQGKGYVAQIQHHGKKKHLGYFQTPEEAHEAYCKAATELHGDFARYN